MDSPFDCIHLTTIIHSVPKYGVKRVIDMKISQFAKASGIAIETVRYYQRSGLLSIPSNNQGYREYTQEHIDEIIFVKNAKSAGFSLSEIKNLRNYHSIQDRSKILELSELKEKTIKEKIIELNEALIFLQELVVECKSSNEKPCPILERLKNQVNPK